MRGFVREHTVAVTTALTVVALALVFGAVGQVGAASLPHPPDAVLAVIPHLNAIISMLAILTIVTGLHAIRDGEVARHRRRMLASFALFATFLVLYLYRVSLEGPTPFGGPSVLERFVYFPVLAIHITLAIVCLPLLFFVLSLAYAYPVARIPETNHKRVGKIAAGLWLVSFSLGLVVYLLLYVIPWG